MLGKVYESNERYVIGADGKLVRQGLYPKIGTVCTQGIQMNRPDTPPEDSRVYTPTHVQASMKASIERKDAYWIANVEEDAFRSNPQDFPKFAGAGLQNCLELVGLARQVAASMPIGMYSDFPANIYSQAMSGSLAALAAQDALAHSVDVLVVRAYCNNVTFDLTRWQDAVAKTSAAFQRWPSKPLLIYLWDYVQQTPDANGCETRLGATQQIARIVYARTLGDVVLWNQQTAGYAISHQDTTVAAVNEYLGQG